MSMNTSCYFCIRHPGRTVHPIPRRDWMLDAVPAAYLCCGPIHAMPALRNPCRLLIIPPPPDHLSSNSHNDPHSHEITIHIPPPNNFSISSSKSLMSYYMPVADNSPPPL